MCIFCGIISKENKADIIFENDIVVAFHDIKPSAPIHVLIVPKKHIPSVNHMTNNDEHIISAMFLAAPLVAEKTGVKEGYKLVFNVGRKGGQIVDHVHMHLLGWPDGSLGDGGKKEVVPV